MAASGALVVAFAALAGWLGWRSLGWPLVHDAPIMHYVAWRVSDGAVPYRDLFDMNFPGAYLLHALALALGGAGDAGWRAFDLAWLALGAAAVWGLARPWGRVPAAGGACLFAVQHLAGGPWHAGQRDYLLAPFLVLGALAVARWAEGGPRRWLVAGGLALGAAATVKPHTALYAVALGALVGVRGPDARGRVAALAALGLGWALPVAAVVAWVAALGGAPAWWDIVTGYLVPLYSRLGRPRAWGFNHWQVWLPVAAAVAISLGRLVAGRALGVRHGVALLGLALGVALYFAQGKGWEYHVYPAAAFASSLAFAGFGARRGGGRPAAAALSLSLVAALWLFAAKGAEAADAAWIRAKVARVGAVVSALEGRLGPDDTVQMLDTTDGGVHALLRLGVRQPTRFLYDFHFFHDPGHPTVERLRREFLRDLAARPPEAVVLFQLGWPGGGYERVAAFPGLARLLGERYAPAAEGDGFRIYARRHDR